MGIVGVWLITWRTAWPAISVAAFFAAVAAVAAVPGWSQRLPPPRAFLSMYFAPALMVAWSGLNWAAEERLPRGEMPWRSAVHVALAVAAVIVAVGAVIRFRRAPRWWLLI